MLSALTPVLSKNPADTWTNTKMDFSVSGTSGQITYDLNGNLLTMVQKGVRPGTAAPLIIDDLRYSYASLSNKLQSVSDLMPTAAINGQFGDLKDGANGSTPDYVYDNNGNLIIDLNKNVQSVNGGAAGTKGIVYNYLDKPELIRIVGKGTVRVVYSANGEKLQRTFIPEAGGASTITTYINEYVYTETATVTTSTATPLGATPTLAFINFEEGRIRAITPVSQTNNLDAISVAGNIVLPNSKSGAFDYFIMDYQENVRMILTEETHYALSTASMETARNTIEEPIFGQSGAANELAASRVDKPTAWTGNTSLKVSRLGNLAGKNIGPNTLQKVMAGDMVNANANYYYASATGGDNTNIVNTVLSSLIQGITGGSAAGSLVKGNTAGINSQLSGTAGFATAVKPTGSDGTTPQAYLTVLFFDERFNFIPAADGGVYQTQVASSVTAAGLPIAIQTNTAKAPKNGYVFVYLSNRSDQHVYFDDFKVSITTGNIIEENHYYAYGMKIAAISSKKLPDTYDGLTKNNNLYNDKELWDDGDLNWYDYGFRNYDPQIGRFTELDPLTDSYPFLTPYQYASCDPITNIDVDGLEGCPSVGGMVGYVSSVGRGLSSGSSIFNGISAIVSTTSIIANTLNLAATIVNTNSQESIVSQQTASNKISNTFTTSTVGNSFGSQVPTGEEEFDIPIFWSEFLFPEIEQLDANYSLTPQGRLHTFRIEGYSEYVFLMFHYEPDLVKQEQNGRDARKTAKKEGKTNPNPKIYDMHEVPYKSTKEGGLLSIMEPASFTQNRSHGTTLRWFYERKNLKDGDIFFVPLRNKKMKKQTEPVFRPIFEPRLLPKKVPNIKLHLPVKPVGEPVFPWWGIPIPGIGPIPVPVI